ncbi:3,4-dihydroxy-9,10-secoandrosta-1,3,5(10)-triene-9,17-dione 4,5-dioxygenase [Prauserella sediminis]|uniref:3,4-dihydroxy-9,10-secoandrosta-1,3, 5(10)-triene-9,17-dione 4,5-dioxygenase n=1 Tax=Prauserella sediminis TaxID=577680 RepID=A0A839XUA8_9PSEU|nr:VOC family protein [Prauserella sediminis]MBB3665619.1 3,4-dihydroxy-9,10-secoandrosta-1,3,5(10)-triene-9,17-dione 4,5-dioxygenase [Prauserella sediminis]
MPVHSLGYLRLESTDLPAWEVFAGEFLGLMPVHTEDDHSLRYRMDEYPPRLVVEPGSESRMTALGLEVLNARDLARTVAAVEAAGIKVTAGTAEECAERRVTGFARFDDPGGNPVELFYGPVLDHQRVQLPTVTSFVTGDMGMGHVIITGEDGPALLEFYTEVLGFFERNTMGSERGKPVWFLSSNDRHHTVGVTGAPGPGRLLHLMVEASTLDDVGLALDRAARLEVPMMNTLGKHTNDYMVSFYVYSPERYAIEFGYGGRRVPGEQPTYEITEGAFWGHHFTPPPAA